MRKFFIAYLSASLLLVFLAMILWTCGGGGGGGGGPTAPTISDLQYSPQVEYTSTTPTTFSGSISFSDPDGDLSSATLTIADSSGATVSTETIPIQGAAGLTSGTGGASVIATLLVADNYTIQVYVTDEAGLRSNVLSGTVRIVEFPWTSMQASSTAREYAAVAVLNGLLYVVGGQRTDAGIIPGPVTSVVEVYDPQTDTWSAAPSMPTARMGLVAAAVDGKLYAIGGSIDGHGAETGTVEEFDPVSQTWTTRASMTTPRYFAAGAQVGGQIFVAGGRQFGVFAPLNIAEAYDPATNSWSSVAPLPTARRELAAAESSGLLYTVGGHAGLLPQWVGTLEVYDPTNNSWSSHPSMHTARSHLALVAVAGKVLAAGGENVNRSVAILESYDTSANVWNVKTPSPFVFSRAAAGVVNGKVYVLGNGFALEYDPANELR